MRPFVVCVLLCALPCTCRAADPTETVIKLRVHPMAAPKPALRYHLLPQLREMNSGNPIQAYLICFMEQNNFYYGKEAVANREKWLTMPLKDLPLKEMRNYGGSSLRQADYAARLETVDWQALHKLRRDGINFLIPEVQLLRGLASALKVRFRAEVAERRFDDALVTAKTMLALSQHLGEHPTLIGDLVGVAVAYVAIGPLEEMVQQPGCPNLYWALSDLPAPFINLRKGLQGDGIFMTTEFQLLDENKPMSEAQMKQVIDRVVVLLKAAEETDSSVGDVRDWVAARTKDADHVRAARKRLVESGLAEAKVKTFPAQQVILLDEKLEYEVQNDESLKVMALPFWEAEKVWAAVPKVKKGNSLYAWAVPASIKVRQAAARLDQRIALLRCVEALRMYAASNDGKLPASLADVKVPIPVDPITGKPFSYKRDGDTATLRGTAPAGQEKIAAYNIRYEVTIVK